VRWRRSGAKQRQVAPHQRDAQVRIGATLVRQKGKQQRHVEAEGDDRQHQDVDVA